MGKYQTLVAFLGQMDRTTHRISFVEIERVLGFGLPKSAYEYEAWWSNNDDGHPHARAWLGCGWRTEAVDLARRQVTFRRSGQFPLLEASSQRRDPWGCMAGTVTIFSGTDLTAPSDDKWGTETGRFRNE